MKKVILVTGASSGIGLACANALQAAGHIVYGSSRNISKLNNVSFNPIELDVTNDDSAKVAVESIVKKEGKIDVLINNAGNGVAGPGYAMPVESAKQQFDVNFFGVVRMCSTVLPYMLQKNSGTVINISSLAGLFGLPYQSMYSASKYAVEGYSESLRMELLKTGINIVVVNPGDFKSDFSQNRAKVKFPINHPELEKGYNIAVESMEKDESIAPSPDMLAKKMVSIVSKSKPSSRYLVGLVSQTMAVSLKKVLPSGLFEKLLSEHYGIK